jgi:hypothetical protein
MLLHLRRPRLRPHEAPRRINDLEEREVTVQEFADRLEALIAEARIGDLSDETIIVELEAAVEALDEGLGSGEGTR